MDKPTHDIDPDGEVIIVLCNADAPFAEWHEDSAPIELVQNHTQGIEASGNYGWKPAVTSEGKKKKRKKKDYKRSLEVLPEPVEEPVEETVEEPVEEPRETGVASEHSGSGRAASQDGLGEISDHDPAKQYNDEDLTERSYRIQVSAKHLELASSVFKKILRGGWKESVTYLQKGSVEITAESWDIEALLILLRVLHCRNSVVPRKLTLEMLAKVAVLADYYECKEAVGFFADTWIDALEKPPTTYCRDLILWLWVSWFFGLDDLFQEVTSTAMSLSTGWINNPGLPIPDRVFESMNGHRQKAISNIVHLLYREHGALLSGSRGCGFECSSIMYGALTKEMNTSGLLSPRPVAPFLNLSYKGVVHKLSSFQSPYWFGPLSTYSRYGTRDSHSCFDSSFPSIFGKLEEQIEGLGLHSLGLD